ncbi:MULTISPECIES: 2'-5' RNA ligase family protein [unclassified Rhizobacter]|uniref:2'-5' RNA ligase family protein n=1 Tax=unclassified Rhizobacter TaxID=2640088 RepID=UPI0009E7DAA0|nr:MULTISPECIES: 2'-5' RNA ligase family protein [unclassified Rhizobacter]
MTETGPEQIGLPGFDEPPTPPPAKPGRSSPEAPHLSLFFALRPPPEVAARIGELAARLRGEHGLTGKLLAPERLHVTLRPMVDDEAQLESAMRAGASLVHAGLDVSFDRAISFPGSGAFVLRSSDNLPALGAFRRQLNLAMGDTEAQASRSATPHMTLLYDKHSIAEHPIEPIGWRAGEFVLVRSHVGFGRHETLAAWPLA